MLERKLIVCADDFGLTEGINEGIIAAYRKGIITRTSIIANGEAFNHAVFLLRQNNDLRVGVHLTLVGESPINQPDKIKSLIGRDEKFLVNYKAFLVRYIFQKVNPMEVYTEWESQIQKLLNSGISINHIDSHQHLHLLPGIFDKTLDLAHKYKIKKIRMLFHDVNEIRSFKELVLALLSSFNKRKLTSSGINCSDRFWGLKHGGNIVENNILNLIDNLKHGTTEMMCHPGYADKDYCLRYGHWHYKPEEELKALCSERVRKKLNDNNIQLVS